MIIGTVAGDREAVIRLAIRGPAGQEQQLDAVVDTGFDGWLSLPPTVVAQLELQWRRRGRAQLADGSECVFDIYEGSLVWDGAVKRVVIDEASTAPISLSQGIRIVLRREKPFQRLWFEVTAPPS